MKNKINKYATGGPTASQFDYTQKAANPLSGSNIDTSGRETLKKGSKGNEVSQLQTFLKNKGYYSGELDGVFGSKTEAAVKGYQE
jgi:peptidoglycan hydrolase-like protein with peptidoglycan-binding domain